MQPSRPPQPAAPAQPHLFLLLKDRGGGGKGGKGKGRERAGKGGRPVRSQAALAFFLSFFKLRQRRHEASQS